MESPKKLFLLLALLAAAVLLPTSGAAAAQPAQTRVIVTLSVPTAADRSAAISQASDALIASLPGGDYTITNRYTVLPYVALSAGPATLAALSVLQQNGLVAAVERDVTVTAAAKKCKNSLKGPKSSKRGKQCKPAHLIH